MLVKNTSRQSLMLVKAFTLTFLCLLLFTGSQDSTSSAEAALKPINPNASDSSRQLLAFLSDISGEYLITGQHDYLESPDEQKNRLGKISGSMPGLHGYELGAISNQSPTVAASQRKSVIHSAIQWSRSGGIVVMTYHQPLPGTAPTWKNVQRKISQAEFDAYVTPGTPQYQRLIRDLDQVAASLKTLKNADVPVLWRPYHEMNGGWFWWGRRIILMPYGALCMIASSTFTSWTIYYGYGILMLRMPILWTTRRSFLVRRRSIYWRPISTSMISSNPTIRSCLHSQGANRSPSVRMGDSLVPRYSKINRNGYIP